jgi:N-hydroxyarylamine O-acetyltransferase
MLDLAAYIKRIGYSGPLNTTVEVLRAIHRAHMLSVPFENLDIFLGRNIACDEQAFIRKIVHQNRGGFCYELNGAFAVLLRALGFTATLLSARVPRQDGRLAPEFDHLTLRVDLGQPWLADVGFGDLFLEPLRLLPGIEQEQGARKLRISQTNDSFLLERTEPDASWKKQYVFSMEPRELTEFAGMCRYHQTSPESHFTQRKLCSVATPDGRITLSDRRLMVTVAGRKDEKVLGSEDEWHQALKEYFGIALPAPTSARSA